ncbi:MAG TPA: hypothetical protein VH682_22140 [Gemmataceae bacterium]|jgi:hypothetical protein
MWKPGLVVGLCVVCGIAGFAQHGRNVHAAVNPAPCPQYICNISSYWWDGDPNNIRAAFIPGTQSPIPVAIANLFSTSSAYNNPQQTVGSKKFDIDDSPACVPSCGWDSNDVWQALQAVSPVQNPTFELNKANNTVTVCTAMPSGQVGPVNPSPVNNNKNEANPPGWSGN